MSSSPLGLVYSGSESLIEAVLNVGKYDRLVEAAPEGALRNMVYSASIEFTIDESEFDAVLLTVIDKIETTCSGPTRYTSERERGKLDLFWGVRDGSFSIVMLRTWNKQSVFVDIASTAQEPVRTELFEFCSELARTKKIAKESDLVPMTITFQGANGVSSVKTKFTCVEWSEEVAANYTEETREKLHHTIETLPESSGRLLIMHGAPGTGKTWFLKYLMRHFRSKYHMITVTDPEMFLGSIAYYYSVLEGLDGVSLSSDDGEAVEGAPAIFIMEDSAENIKIENREAYGQRISRLLNMSDGLLSEGRGDIFIITFNDDVEIIDPAMLRPGRCKDSINFGCFTKEDAFEWLLSHGLPEEIAKAETIDGAKDRYTLGMLYAILNNDMPQVVAHARREIGFR